VGEAYGDPYELASYRKEDYEVSHRFLVLIQLTLSPSLLAIRPST
jgi:hypothetical protein